MKLSVKSSKGWRWSLKDESVWTELAPDPSTPSSDSIIVKSNPVRTVFRRGRFFIKVERPEQSFGLSLLKSFLRPKAQLEFETALMLSEAGIPVVEPVGYGAAGSAQALITEAFEGSLSVSDFYYKEFCEGNANPQDFLLKWSAFIRKILASGFQHPDFHNGNILYAPDSGELRLVDVFGIKRGQPKNMRRIVLELRMPLTAAQLIELAGACGLSQSELVQEFDNEASRIQREWPKRKRQLLSGYVKFADWRKNGKLLLLKDKARHLLATEEQLASGLFERENGEDVLLKSFHLELCGLRHRRAVAYEPETQTVYFEKLSQGQAPSAEELENFHFQARPFGIEATGKDFLRDAYGRLVLK